MGDNSIFNIGKSIFNELKDKLIEQGKDTLQNSKDEILQKSKETILDVTNDKVNKYSKGKINLNSFINSIDNKEQEQSLEPNLDNAINKRGNNSNDKNPLHIIVDSEDEKYRNGDQFEKLLNNNLENLSVKSISNPSEAAFVLKELITLAGEVEKFSEVQKTKRKEIEAQRDAYVAKINAQKVVMLAYLDRTFDERKNNFENLFKIVDHALENNNMQQLALGLDSINNLAATSPFKDLTSIQDTKNALEDKNHVWDI
ncbi:MULTISPECIES: hypothetical protein [Empedobacter]|uniref:hypothetical protein n=1 Tax=Empedobacter TaxID=59734 RepID=UPI0025B86168|nr:MULTISPECIES: hypothetical protein [unclassified Empedobacter]